MYVYFGANQVCWHQTSPRITCVGGWELHCKGKEFQARFACCAVMCMSTLVHVRSLLHSSASRNCFFVSDVPWLVRGEKVLVLCGEGWGGGIQVSFSREKHATQAGRSMQPKQGEACNPSLLGFGLTEKCPVCSYTESCQLRAV